MNNRKHPKEIAKDAYDNGHIPTFLASLCSLIMCADPTPLSKEQDESVRKGADRMAQRLGFTDWVEAYHGLNSNSKPILNKDVSAKANGPCCAHDSDCAIHNAPAYPVGPFNCTVVKRFEHYIDIERKPGNTQHWDTWQAAWKAAIGEMK